MACRVSHACSMLFCRLLNIDQNSSVCEGSLLPHLAVGGSNSFDKHRPTSLDIPNGHASLSRLRHLCKSQMSLNYLQLEKTLIERSGLSNNHTWVIQKITIFYFTHLIVHAIFWFCSVFLQEQLDELLLNNCIVTSTMVAATMDETSLTVRVVSL